MLLLSIMLSLSGASPTYLTCEIVRKPDNLPVEFAVDEANQQVTVALPTTGKIATRRALFSPTEVTVPDGEATWLISRTSLSVTRTFKFSPDGPGEAGACKVKPAPETRAF